PTFGRIPNYNGSLPERAIGGQLMSVSGPLARTIGDIRLAFEAMAHGDVRDPWWVPAALRGEAFLKRVALCLAPDGLDVEKPIVDALLEAAARLREAGWRVEEVDQIPPLREAANMQVKLWLGDEYDASMAAARAEGDPGALAMLEG